MQEEPAIGATLPCNVILREIAPGKTEVSAIDPSASMAAVENDGLGDVATEVRDRLRRVFKGFYVFRAVGGGWFFARLLRPDRTWLAPYSPDGVTSESQRTLPLECEAFWEHLARNHSQSTTHDLPRSSRRRTSNQDGIHADNR